METFKTAFETLLSSLLEMTRQRTELEFENAALHEINEDTHLLNIKLTRQNAVAAQSLICADEDIAKYKSGLGFRPDTLKRQARIIGVTETLWVSGAKVLAIQFYRDMFDTDLVTARDAVKRIVNDN